MEKTPEQKREWETPTMTVVGLASDVRSEVGPLNDEDFDGFPS